MHEEELLRDDQRAILERLYRIDFPETVDGRCEECGIQGWRWQLGRFKLCQHCCRRRVAARSKSVSA